MGQVFTEKTRSVVNQAVIGRKRMQQIQVSMSAIGGHMTPREGRVTDTTWDQSTSLCKKQEREMKKSIRVASTDKTQFRLIPIA